MALAQSRARTEMEWQCSHLSEHIIDVKPRGSVDSTLKLLKQSEWAHESVGNTRNRCISHYTNIHLLGHTIWLVLIYLFLSYWTCWWQVLVLVPLITSVVWLESVLQSNFDTFFLTSAERASALEIEMGIFLCHRPVSLCIFIPNCFLCQPKWQCTWGLSF